MTGTAVERPPLAEDPADIAERRAAARHLLRYPLVPAGPSNAAALRGIRRHQAELTRLFADGAGYRLHVDPSGARLFKTGLGRDPSRPRRRRSGAAFTPRTYALLTLVLAALTRSRSQLLVDELVAQVRSAAVDAGVDVDLDGITDRRALHAALVALIELGVLSERDGDLEHWAEKCTQSLLDVRHDLLVLMVSAPLGSAASPQELLDVSAVPSAVGGARMAVRRLLLESPVLTVADLPDEHAEWWSRNRHREREWFHDHFGLDVELRAEGAVAVDPDDELSDEEFPGRGATRHLALLCLEQLAALARDAAETGRPWCALPLDEARRRCLAVLKEWSEVMRRDQREEPQRAVTEALELLRLVGLVRQAESADGAPILEIHAAGCRYAPAPRLVEASATGESSLFDTEGTDDG